MKEELPGTACSGFESVVEVLLHGKKKNPTFLQVSLENGGFVVWCKESGMIKGLEKVLGARLGAGDGFSQAR